MGKQELKTLWMGVMVILLAATAPTWLDPDARKPMGYDAPWIYPSLNPVVTNQMSHEHSVLRSESLSYAAR